MTNPSDLLDAIVDALQALPDLVSAIGGNQNLISAHKHQWPTSTSWMLALREQKASPSVLVVYRSTRNGRWGTIPSRVHDFSLLIRDGENVNVFTLYAAIAAGFCSGSAIHQDVEMVTDPEIFIRTVMVTETAYLDYHEMQFGLTEKFA